MNEIAGGDERASGRTRLRKRMRGTGWNRIDGEQGERGSLLVLRIDIYPSTVSSVTRLRKRGGDRYIQIKRGSPTSVISGIVHLRSNAYIHYISTVTNEREE